METFNKAIQFLQLPNDLDRIQRALEFSHFEQLQAQEMEKGFLEKSPCAKSFFRQGKMDSYRDTLNEEQIQKIRDDHCVMMKEFGYW